jgi:hypothetical protein
MAVGVERAREDGTRKVFYENGPFGGSRRGERVKG